MSRGSRPITICIALAASALFIRCSTSARDSGAPSDSSGTCVGLDAGCATSNGDAGPLVPCDPLTPPPVTLGTILGVGEDTQPTLYVADEAPGDLGEERVFVSSGGTLYQKFVAGSGQSPAGYTFSFQDTDTDASDAQALLIQGSGGVVTAMALGPAGSKSFFAPDAGDAQLTVLDAGAIAGFALQGLPVLVEYVADVSDGSTVVVTEPMQPAGYAGFRLFYGAPNPMVERAISNYDRGDNGDDIAFAVGSVTYTAHFTWTGGIASGGGAVVPGPGSLDTASGTLQMTQRLPTPSTLSGFAFTCFER